MWEWTRLLATASPIVRDGRVACTQGGGTGRSAGNTRAARARPRTPAASPALLQQRAHQTDAPAAVAAPKQRVVVQVVVELVHVRAPREPRLLRPALVVRVVELCRARRGSGGTRAEREGGREAA